MSGFKAFIIKMTGMVIISLLFISPTLIAENTPVANDTGTRQTFTHSVFAEDITAQWCVYCPSASEALNNIYNSGDYEFHFVSMITQDGDSQPLNDDAQQRAEDYKVTGYPTVMFDGGYEEVIGGQSDESNYRTAIESCGARPVPELEIDLTANYMGDEKIDVDVKITNMDSEAYAGELRVYITEIESRYDDYDGNKYPYGFLDYALTEDISIAPSDTYDSGSVTWDSKTEKDAQGNSFGIPDPDNIMVFAVVFNSERNIKTRVAAPPNNIYFAYYVDQSASSKLGSASDDKTPPDVSVLQPQNNDRVKGTVEIKVKATDNFGIQNVVYKIDSGTWLQMSYSGSDDIYTASWDTSSGADGIKTISVEAKDQASNVGTASVSVQVANSAPSDTSPPSITISSPKETDTLSGVISIIAVVTDDWGVASVEYQVNDGAAVPMFAIKTANTYQASWDTTMVDDGYHTLKVNAADTSSNANSESVYVQVDNSGTQPTIDTEPPVLIILEPDSGDTISGTQDLSVMAYDNKGISKVECSIVFGSSNWQQLGATGGDEYTLDLDTNIYPDDDYDIIFRATDTSNNIATETITVTISNEFKDLIKPTIKPLVPTSGDIVSGSFEIKVEVKDNYEIDQVSFSVDSGNWLQMINTRHNTFTGTLDTSQFPNGKHTLSIKALDSTGNEELQTIDFEISNTVEKEEDRSPLPGFEGLFTIIALVFVIILINKRK